MATIDWHTSLPQSLLVDGYRQEPADNLLRSQMDRGPAKVRKDSSAGPRPVSGSILVTAAQLATYKSFHKTTLLDGALRFNWVDPDDGTTAVEMRIVKSSWAPANKAATRFIISLELEILP
jgi:hypothetical protein